MNVSPRQCSSPAAGGAAEPQCLQCHRGEEVGFKMEPESKDRYRAPGLRAMKSTTLFRAVNPELFIKPNKPVMALGLLTLTLCVGYLGYLHAVKENSQQLYEAVDSEGERYMRRKTSKWD